MAFLLHLGLLLFLAAHPSQEKPSIKFSGMAINKANPDNPIAAPIEFISDEGGCRLTVSQPLNGSGSCYVKDFDQQSGKIVIVSFGPPIITWTGTIKGNLASGDYTVVAPHQTGSFYMAFSVGIPKAPPPPLPEPPAKPVYLSPIPRSSCVPAVEASISGDFHGWDGETIFKLDNGQIWQQAEYDYNYDYDYAPDVTIYSTSAGCKMKVDGEDETILVKRIK